MNIGIVIPGFSDGEQDWCIPVYLNLVRELAQSNSVTVFAMRYPSRRDHYKVYGAQVVSIGGHSSTAGIGRIALMMRTVASIVREHRSRPFAVLHAIWADETGVTAEIAGRLIGVPAVVSVAGGELSTLPGYGLQGGRLSRWLVRWALIHADCVTVPCNYVARLIEQQRLEARRCEVVPLGVDTTLFKPSDRPRIDNRLLAVGSLSHVKGHDRLIQALAQLPDLSLDIVGDGPLRSELEQLAQSLGIANRVTFHGAVEHDQLPQFYQRAALHVLSSRHEAFGMVVIEAAACGLPTVGFALGVVPDFAGAVAVKRDDVEALAVTIRDVMSDPARRDALAIAARSEVEARYSVQVMAAGFRHLW
jgi:glycosyltransferase involved in cell wall biosynthesis